VDLIKSQASQNDPQKVIDAAKGLVEISRPPEDKEGKTVLTLLLSQMEEQRKESADQRRAAAAEASASRTREFELLKEMLTKSKVDAPDPIADIERYAKLGKTLKESFGPSESETAIERQSRMNGTQELIVELTKAVSPVLEKAMGLFTVMAAAKQSAQPARPPRPTTVDVAPAGEQPQQPAQTNEQPAQPEAPQPPTMEQAQQQILNFVLGSATPTLQHYLETSDGESFAGWFCDTAFSLPGVPPPFNRLNGVDAHKFAKQHGKDAILEAYKKNPALYQQIAPNSEAEEKFIRFLDAFLAYDPEAESDDGDPD
jgi:hypothetical protein